MEFTANQIKIAKRLSYGAKLFKSYFFSKSLFEEQFKDGYKALVCFVENYAYERQGAASAYSEIAKKAIKKQFDGSVKSVTFTDAKEAWKHYQEIAKSEYNSLGVNPSLNPMNSDGGILAVMAKGNIINLASYVKGLIQSNQTKQAYRLLTGIRGIGPKIASLYLRDITYNGKLAESEIKDQRYLQPIDTWIDQALKIIFRNKKPKALKEKQEIIVKLCKAAKVSPISFNQGAWVLGSKIAGDFKTFQQIAEGHNVKQIISEHIKDEKSYIHELERLLQNWPEL